MIIEYHLKGSKLHHKGVFDTTGFWARFDSDICDVSGKIETYKIYSHFSFTFEHEEKEVAEAVYNGLLGVLAEIDFVYPGVGYIREVC